MDFSFLLNASLDVFDARCRDKNKVDQDLGLLQAVDERLSIWGWQTGTGARFALIIDAWGKEGKPTIERKDTGDNKEGKSSARRGVQSSDIKPVSVKVHSTVKTNALMVVKGVQSLADGIHQTATESILHTGRPYAHGSSPRKGSWWGRNQE